MSSDRTSSTDLPQGTVFGPYLIVRILGRGGMGAVYEAMHVGLEKRVALKTLVSELLSQDEARERFTREARAAAQLRHPHVVDVFDVGVHEGVPYLAMEFLEGESLSQRIDREGSLTPATLAELMLPVCSAVAAAHDAQIVHRDLKPDNIFLARSRPGVVVPKLLDFGIAKQVSLTAGGGLTKTDALLGTPNYMSPEQARGAKAIDARSDQFSLGVILYECLTGKLPFDGEGLYDVLHGIISGSFKRPREVRSDIPEAVEAMILRAMEGDPDARYPHVRSLGAALLAFAGPGVSALWEGEFGRVSIADTAIGARAPSIAAPPRVVSSTLSTVERRAPARAASARRGVLGVLGGLAVVLGITAGVARLRGGAPPADTRPAPLVVRPLSAPTPVRPTTFAAQVSSPTPGVQFSLDGAPAVTLLDQQLPRDGRPHTLVVRADGFEPRTLTFTDAAPPREVTLAAVPAPPPMPAASVPARPRRTHPPRHHRSAPVGPSAGTNDMPY